MTRRIRLPAWVSVASVSLAIWLVGAPGMAVTQPGSPAAQPAPGAAASTEHVILFVLEGIGHDSLKGGSMPVLNRLVKDGSVTWSATAVQPALRLPTMASLLTGMPVDKHGVTWNAFEFNRGYPRPPTVFDYLDLSGGRDSAIFFMDESLYQLARPEPYTDYQMCGPLKPECNPATVVGYIKQYFRKATSGHGYGHAILALPHLLVVHLPEPGRAAETHAWTSKEYREALRAVDQAMGSVLELYRELGLYKRTTVFVTSLSGTGIPKTDGNQQVSSNGNEGQTGNPLPVVPWIASGVGIKSGHAIRQSVSILDTGATVLRSMGLETHTEWDSHPVEEIFQAGFVPAAPNLDQAGSTSGY